MKIGLQLVMFLCLVTCGFGTDMQPCNADNEATVRPISPSGILNIRQELLNEFIADPSCPDGFNSFLVQFKYVGRVLVEEQLAHVVEIASVTYAANPRRSGFIALFGDDGRIRGSVPAIGIQHCNGSRLYFSELQGVYLDYGDEIIPGNAVDVRHGWPQPGDLLDWVRVPRAGTALHPSEPELGEVLGPGSGDAIWDVMLRTAKETAPEFALEDVVIVSFGHIGEVECDEGVLHVAATRGVNREGNDTEYSWIMLFDEEGSWKASVSVDASIDPLYCDGPLVYLDRSWEFNGRNGNALLIVGLSEPVRVVPVRHFGVGPQEMLLR